jgi:hypothetical protein
MGAPRGNDLMKYYFLSDDSEKSLAPFFSKMVLSAGFGSVVIAGILLLFFWPRQPLAGYLIINEIPLCFFLASATVLIVCGYVSLICGCGEMIPRHFYVRHQTDVSTYEKEFDFFRYGLIESLLHTFVLLLPFLPLLILAASTSVASMITLFKAVCVLYSALLVLRLIGFLMYLFWGRLSSMSYFMARLFMVVFVFGTLPLSPHINPLRILYQLNQNPDGTARPFALYMALTVFAILLLVTANHRLVRRHLSEEKTT